VEFYIKKDTGGKLTWWASYAFASVNDDVREIWNYIWTRKIDREIPSVFDQRHTFYFDMNYRLNANWQFNVAWEYHTGTPYTDMIIVGEETKRPDMDEFNDSRYPVYHRMDVRINRHFYTSRGRVTAFLEILNLYDQKNIAYFDYTTQSFSDGNRVQSTFTKSPVHWFPMMPSVGVSWSWNN
jgi:outer membrane receptor for Fe3+-dicitrate